MNEFPLKKLFKYIDGVQNGPTQFLGSIGKVLLNSERNSVIDYQTIEYNDYNINNLNSDSKYLNDICK